MTLVTQQTNDYLILNEQEQEAILNLFPEKLRSYIKSCNNPLDETQVLVNLFKDKNVRIILRYEKDKYDDMDWISYFHCIDLAENVKYDKRHIEHWKSRWSANLITYENLTPHFGEPKICEINKRRTDKNAYYINEQDLKKVLIKINSKEANIFQEWILEQSTLMKKISKKMIEVKRKYETDILNKQIKECNKKINKLEKSKEQLLELTKQAVKLYPPITEAKGVVYIVTSEDKGKDNIYKIGYTTKTGKCRINNMKTGDPLLNLIEEYECINAHFAESIIHKFLDHLRVYKDKEFFYVSSEEVVKRLVKQVVKNVNKLYEEYSKDNEILQDMMINKENDVKSIKDTIENKDNIKDNEIDKDKVDEDDIFKLYLDERTRESKTHILIRELYDDFKYWYQTNNPNKKIPNSREFAKEIKKYHTVNDRVRVNNSVSTGILNLSIVNNE